MPASKLISLCKVAMFTLLLAVSCQASAGYYIEYMDPCVDYDACNGPQHHGRYHHYRSHYRHHAPRYHHSSASISVYYYWNVYPAYPCEMGCGEVHHCSTCVRPCHSCASENDYGYSRPVIHYRENDYRSRYYRNYNRTYSDVDYDTSTADDMQ